MKFFINNILTYKMSFEIICIGDVHFMIENIPEVDIFIEKMEQLIRDVKPNIIVILGDVLHTHERIHVTPLNRAYDFIRKMSLFTKTFVLVGNHDFENNQVYLSENHWMNGMKYWKNVTIVDKVHVYEVNKMKFIFSPYVFPGRFIEALNTCETDWKDGKCIFAHQEFRGAKMGSIISSEGDQWSLDYPQVVSGHIHSRQIIQDNIYYTGSAMQHAFGESEHNIIACLTFSCDTKKYQLREVDLKLPRKRILYKEVGDMDEFLINKTTEDKIKITVNGSYEEFKAFKKTKKYKEILETGTKIIFKPTRAEIKTHNENINMLLNQHNNFRDILSSIITSQKNVFLSEIYEKILNNNTICHNDIFFLET